MSAYDYRFRSARRDYTVYTVHGGAFRAQYQPLNKKTGRPWQAYRNIKGGDVHVVSNWDTKEIEVRPGNLPRHSDWTEDGRWTSGSHEVFSTLELAKAAIAKDAEDDHR